MQGVREAAGGAKIIAWDVVNEAITQKGDDPFKETVWYPALPNYVDRAFTHARAADPEALLFYNDYHLVTDDN